MPPLNRGGEKDSCTCIVYLILVLGISEERFQIRIRHYTRIEQIGCNNRVHVSWCIESHKVEVSTQVGVSKIGRIVVIEGTLSDSSSAITGSSHSHLQYRGEVTTLGA